MTGHYESEDWRSFDLGHPGGEETTRWLLEESGLKAGSKVLDLCCGAGDSIKIFKEEGLEVYGIDRPGVLEHTKTKYPEIEERGLCAWEGGEKFPFQDQTFDAVLCECSLSLFQKEKRESVLEEVRRILKDEGLLLLSDMTEEEPMVFPSFDLLDWRDGSEHVKPFIARWIWRTGKKYPRACAGDSYFLGIYRKQTREIGS